MSIQRAGQAINNISNKLYTEADNALSGAGGISQLQAQLIQQAQQTAINNLQEQLKAGDWQAGIRTEKQLLSNGVSLAKA